MKSYKLFCYILCFIASFVFTWNAQSGFGQLVGYVTIIIMMIIVTRNIIAKLEA